MVKRNEVLGIYGSELIAKAGERIFIEVDKATGKLVAPLYARPSFWINMGLGIGIPLVTLMRKANSKWALPAVAAGGHFFSKVVDYAEEIVSPITARVAAAAERVVYKPPATDGNQRVHTRMPTVSVGVSASYDATPFI